LLYEPLPYYITSYYYNHSVVLFASEKPVFCKIPFSEITTKWTEGSMLPVAECTLIHCPLTVAQPLPADV